jgi:hypothetical protein
MDQDLDQNWLNSVSNMTAGFPMWTKQGGAATGAAGENLRYQQQLGI